MPLHLLWGAGMTQGRLPTALQACRLATQLGPLISDGPHYRFGSRLFNGATVRAIASEGPVQIIRRRRKRGRSGQRYDKPHRLEVRFSDTMQQSLKAISDSDGIPMSEVIRKFVASGISARRKSGRSES